MVTLKKGWEPYTKAISEWRANELVAECIKRFGAGDLVTKAFVLAFATARWYPDGSPFPGLGEHVLCPWHHYSHSYNPRTDNYLEYVASFNESVRDKTVRLSCLSCPAMINGVSCVEYGHPVYMVNVYSLRHHDITNLDMEVKKFYKHLMAQYKEAYGFAKQRLAHWNEEADHLMKQYAKLYPKALKELERLNK